jgi:hypothetical protein
MALSDHLETREQSKFRSPADGLTAVAVINSDGSVVGSGIGGVSMTDDAAFTPAASSVTPIGATADETSPDSVDEGDIGAVRMTLDRLLWALNLDEVGFVHSANAKVAITRTAIAAATNGNNILVVNSNGGKQLVVLALFVFAGAAGNIYFTSDSAGAVIFGGSTNTIQLAANQGFVLPYLKHGWMITSANHDVVMNASSTGPFSGGLLTVEI